MRRYPSLEALRAAMMFPGIYLHAVAAFASGRVVDYAHPLHLWFLKYLIALYTLAAIVVAVVPLVLSERARAAVALPPLAKMAIVVVGAIAVLMPLYRYGVRPTFIGAVPNGRRYPSTIGVVEPGPRLEDRGAQDAVH